MSKSNPVSITVEEAVARMVNLDYIPEGLKLLEMLRAYKEADDEYEEACSNGLSRGASEHLAIRANCLEFRYELAQSLWNALQYEIETNDGSIDIVQDELTDKPRVTLKSVTDWAADKFGICIPECRDAEKSAQQARWEDVEIKIYAGYKIGYRLGDGKYIKSSFQKIGLMGTRKHEPNYLGGVLIGLSNENKFPTRKNASGSDKTNLSRLRCSLKNLTGITSDPFYKINEADGWTPRFTLIDDRKNAEERAKNEAKHVSYDEERNYED